jgi:tetratricopeptide (TPR) repeat protein
MRFQLYDTAISLYTTAIELEPQNKYLYKQRAFCFFENDDKENALIDYQKALEIDSADAQLYISRADLFKITGRFKEAIDDFSAALRFDPDNYFLYSERADCFIRSEDTLAALKDLQKSVFGESKNVFKYIRRAGIYEALGLYTEAIQDYDQVIKIENSPGFYLSRAILYSKCGNRNSALSDYLVYLAQEPNNASALNNAAYCYLYNNEFELAEKYFIKALKNDHNHFDAYLGLSLLHYRQKDLRKSLKAMLQAIDSRGLLGEGINGLNYLKQNGYFWNKDEEADLIKIFGIMGLDTKINKRKIKTFRVSAQRPD